MDNLDEKYKSKNPFTVPDRYFDTLGDRTFEDLAHFVDFLQRLSQIKDEDGKTRKTSLFQTLKPYLGLAGLFAFAMIVVQLLVPNLVDENRMLLKNGEQANMTAQAEDENIFDADFNPSREEIIEYLSQETDPIEFLYAERR